MGPVGGPAVAANLSGSRKMSRKLSDRFSSRRRLASNKIARVFPKLSGSAAAPRNRADLPNWKVDFKNP
jgi:hypothetical protein